MSKLKDGDRKVTFWQDEHPDDPREWDNLGLMACWHRRYVLGDVQPKEDSKEWLESQPSGSVSLPLYLYDHSGLSISTGSFSCPWDSGQVGWIVATPEAIQEHCRQDVTEEEVEEHLRAEVEVYHQYLSGACYGYTQERYEDCGACGKGTWEFVDGCGGFYGPPEESGVMEHFDAHWKASAQEAWERFVG